MLGAGSNEGQARGCMLRRRAFVFVRVRCSRVAGDLKKTLHMFRSRPFRIPRIIPGIDSRSNATGRSRPARHDPRRAPACASPLCLLLHAFGKYGTFPWCSWLSRQPNMLKVRGSNPCDDILPFLWSVPPLSLFLSLSLPLATGPETLQFSSRARFARAVP